MTLIWISAISPTHGAKAYLGVVMRRSRCAAGVTDRRSQLAITGAGRPGSVVLAHKNGGANAVRQVEVAICPDSAMNVCRVPAGRPVTCSTASVTSE